MRLFIRLAVTLAVAAVLWGLPGSQAAAAPNSVVTLLPASQNVQVGQTFTIDVEAQDVVNLGAYEFTITFDPSLLQLVSVANTDFLGSTGREVACQGPLEPPYVQADEVRFGCASSALEPPGPVGAGTLAKVTFRASAAGLTSLGFRLMTLTDPAVEDLCCSQTRGAVVRIVAPGESTSDPPPPTPTSRPGPVQPTPPTGLPTPTPSVLAPAAAAGTQPPAGPSLSSTSGGQTPGAGAGAAAGTLAGATGSGQPSGDFPGAGTGPPPRSDSSWATPTGIALAVLGAALLVGGLRFAHRPVRRGGHRSNTRP